MSHSPQIAVIGAGIVGAASALHALQAGLRVTLIDPHPPGNAQASSYGNAGWLSSHSIIPPATPGVWRQVPGWLTNPLGPLTVRWRYLVKAVPWLLRYLESGRTYEQIEQTAKGLRALLRDAPDLHLEMAKIAGVPQLIQKNGLLHVYPSREQFHKDTRLWQIRGNEGVRWLELDHQELTLREPHLNPRYQFGLFVPDTGHCNNPGLYVQSVVQHIVRHGGAIAQTEATGFRYRNGQLHSVVTTAGEIECSKAVIATGARAKALAHQAGDEVCLETERGYHAVISSTRVGPHTPTMLMDEKVIVTAMTTGLRIAGQVEIAALDDTPNWKRAEVLCQLLARAYPSLSCVITPDQINVWMGRRPSTPDGLPCIGRASRSPDIIHAYGHGHVGLAGSARTGRIVAQLLTNQSPEIELSPYSAQRFSKS